nr:hypothetical protein [Tanacetum cinerariifolium]
MRHYLLLAATSLLLASCASTKPLPQYTEAQKQAQREAIGYWQPEPDKRDSTAGPRIEPGSQADLIRQIFEGKAPVVQVEAAPDSLKFVKVPKPATRRLFGLLPAKAAPLSQVGGVGGGVPRKCKGCTFNVVAGDQNNVAKKGQALGAGASVKGD